MENLDVKYLKEKTQIAQGWLLRMGRRCRANGLHRILYSFVFNNEHALLLQGRKPVFNDFRTKNHLASTPGAFRCEKGCAPLASATPRDCTALAFPLCPLHLSPGISLRKSSFILKTRPSPLKCHQSPSQSCPLSGALWAES